MACHAARVIRQRHKAEHDMLETDLSPGGKISPGTLITIVVAANGVWDRAPAYDVSSLTHLSLKLRKVEFDLKFKR